MTISAFSFISIMRWALVGGGGCNRTKMHLINSLAAELFELGGGCNCAGGGNCCTLKWSSVACSLRVNCKDFERVILGETILEVCISFSQNYIVHTLLFGTLHTHTVRRYTSDTVLTMEGKEISGRWRRRRMGNRVEKGAFPTLPPPFDISTLISHFLRNRLPFPSFLSSQFWSTSRTERDSQVFFAIFQKNHPIPAETLHFQTGLLPGK